MPTVIDSLIVKLGLDPDDYKKGAADAKKAQDELKSSATASANATEEQAKKTGKTTAKVGKARKDEADAQSKREKRATKENKDAGTAEKKRFDDAFSGLKKMGFAAAGAVLGFESLRGALQAYTETTDRLANMGRFAPTVDTSVEKIGMLADAYKQVGGKAEDATADLAKFAHAQYSLSVHTPDALAGYARRYHVALLDQNLKPRAKEDIAKDFGEQIRRATPDLQTQASIAREMGMSEAYIQLYILKQADERERILDTAKKTAAATEAAAKDAQKVNTAYTNLGNSIDRVKTKMVAAFNKRSAPLLDRAAQSAANGHWGDALGNWVAANLMGALGDSSKSLPGIHKEGKYHKNIAAVEDKYGIPRGLLSGVAATESQFDPNAVNKKSGATGMFQLMPQFFPDAGKDWKADANTAGGELKRLYKHYGSWDAALAAYNHGQGNVDKSVEAGGTAPSETRAYVPRVEAYRAQINALNSGGTRASATGGAQNSGNTNVQIDEITINTQAKDAGGIAKTIAPALKRKGVVANANTGLN